MLSIANETSKMHRLWSVTGTSRLGIYMWEPCYK